MNTQHVKCLTQVRAGFWKCQVGQACWNALCRGANRSEGRDEERRWGSPGHFKRCQKFLNITASTCHTSREMRMLHVLMVNLYCRHLLCIRVAIRRSRMSVAHRKRTFANLKAFRERVRDSAHEISRNVRKPMLSAGLLLEVLLNNCTCQQSAGLQVRSPP